MKRIKFSAAEWQDLQKILNGKRNRKKYCVFSRDKEAAYKFVNKVGIRICPYCNINYVYSVANSKAKICRPELDHFFPQTYENKQLSAFNLVPACHTCNLIKSDEDTLSKKYSHPYFCDFDSIMRFAIIIKDPNYLNPDNFSLEFVQRDPFAHGRKEIRARNNIDLFKLRDRYQHHKIDVVDWLCQITNYDEAKLQEIEDILKLSKYSFLYLPTYDINNVSLGKLKQDIFKIYG